VNVGDFGCESLDQEVFKGEFEPTDEYRKRYWATILTDSLEASPDLSHNHRISYDEAFSGPNTQTNTFMENPRDYPSIRTQLFHSLEWMTETLLERFGPAAIGFQNRSLNVIQGDPLFSNNAALVRGTYNPFLVFGPELDFKYDEAGIPVYSEHNTLIEVLGRPYSFDLSVVAHELAHANLYFVSGIDSNGPNTGVCGPGCCATTAGCIRAIDEGQADFFSSILFPSSPAMGDGMVDTIEGITICGIPRNAELNAHPETYLTFPDAFVACNNPDFYGQIHALGAVYASVWWNVRDAQSTITDKENVERLFLEHLKLLDSTSDFCSTIEDVYQAASILSLGTALAQAFENEITNRGLNCN